MVPRQGWILCLSILITLSSASTAHKAGVQAVSGGEFADKGTPTCRRDAAHTGVSADTHGLSEHQTSREIDLRDVVTATSSDRLPTRFPLLPSPDRFDVLWAGRLKHESTIDAQLARGTSAGDGGGLTTRNSTSIASATPCVTCKLEAFRFHSLFGHVCNAITLSVPFVLPIIISLLCIVCAVLDPDPRPARRRPLTAFNLAVVLFSIGRSALKIALFRCLRRLAVPIRIALWPVHIALRLIVLIVRIVRWIDCLTFAIGLLTYGICLVVYGYARLVALVVFDSIMSWTCFAFGMPYHYEGIIDEALMMSSTDNDWDARKYPKCKPYFGKRGVEFEKFVRDFGAAIAGDGDDDASLEDTMLGMDPGGDAAGAPVAIGGAAAARRRAKRLRDLYAALYRHVPEPRLREMMHATARNDGRAVFRMLEANCRQAIDDLELLQMDGDWNSATILNSVGFNVDSITLFSRHLNGLNALRPAANRKTEDDLTTKFLACVDTNIEATLGHEAKKELRARGGARQFVNAATGTRDFQACVTFFDDLWRSHFRSGDIRPRPRQTAAGGASSRADADVVDDRDADGDAAFLAGGGNRKPSFDRARMSSEANCWNCRGFGHMADACPSEKGFRAISDAAALLSNMIPNRPGRGRGGFGRGSFGRGRGGPPRRPVRRFGNARVTLDEGLVFDDDGNIFSTDGTYVGSVDTPPPPTPDEEPPAPPPADEPPDDAQVANSLDDTDDYVGDMFAATDVTIVETGPSSLLPCTCQSRGYGRLYNCTVCCGDIFECLLCGKWRCLNDCLGQPCNRSGTATPSAPRDLNRELTADVDKISAEEICAQESLFAPFAQFPGVAQPPSAPPSCPCTCHRNPGCTTCVDCAFCDPQLWSRDRIWDPDRGCTVSRCGSPLQCIECGSESCDSASDTSEVMSLPGLISDDSCADSDSPECVAALLQREADVDAWTNVRAAPRAPMHAASRGPCSTPSAVMAMLSTAFTAAKAIARGSVLFLRVFLTFAFGLLLGLHRGLGTGLALGAGLVQVPIAGASAPSVDAFDSCYCLGKFKSNDSDWIVDCGATKHCTPCLSDLAKVTNSNPNKVIRVGNGKHLAVTAIGTVRLKVPTSVVSKRKNKTKIESGHELMELSNVYVVPEMKCRLMSSEWAWRHDGIGTYLNDDRYLRLPSGAHVGFKHAGPDGHYRIAEAYASSDMTFMDSELWHASLAHFSPSRIGLAKQHGYTALNGYTHDPSTCAACLANRRKKSIPSKSTSGHVYTYFGEMVCSDICGPFEPSPQGFQYALNFYDKYSHHASVYFMRDKTSEEIKRCHQTWMADHKCYLKDGKMGCWMTDDGTNFHTDALDEMCVELSTRRAFAIPHVKEKHGSAERLFGILLAPVRKLGSHAGNDTGKVQFWPFLMTHVCMVHNALPTASLSPVASPHELMAGKKFDISIFKGKVPLSDCWVNTSNPDDKPVSKLGPNNIKAVYLCHDQRRRGDFVFLPELGRITTAWHVTHCPWEFTMLGDSVVARRSTHSSLPTSTGTGSDVMPPVQSPLPVVKDRQGNAAVPPPENIADVDFADIFSSHADAFVARCGINCCVVSPNAVGPVRIPTGYWDAVNDPVYGEKWKEACDSEHAGKLLQNRSWVYEHKPGNRTLTKSKWVFKVEYNPDGSVKRFKARIVACGYSQIEGLDWTEKYASTLSSDSMRTFLFDANQCGDELCEADVVKAFTHATIEEEIYMAPPEGYAPKDGKVCRLRKGVEGLKQGANGFMKLNATVIESEGLKRSMLDPNVYTRTRDGVTLKVGCYVDNLLASYPSSPAGRKQCAEFFKAYGKKINLEIRGPPKVFMGVQLEHDNGKGTLFLNQSKYMEQAFERFCDKSTKIFTTPVQTGACEAFAKLRSAETDAERAAMSDKPYLSLMGSILWAVIMTRPDCSFHASFLCQFMSDPTIECWQAGIALLSYMYGTRTLGLLYRRCKNVRLSLYCDSSYGEPKPMYGFVVFANGTPISWTAKKQKIVPQSSCEAETAALCSGCKNLVFIRNLLSELGTAVELPMQTHTDNDATRLSTINPGTTARTKHYEIWMRYCRELYLNLVIVINWVPTKEQIADLFTKPLDKTTFLYLRSLLMSHSSGTGAP